MAVGLASVRVRVVADDPAEAEAICVRLRGAGVSVEAGMPAERANAAPATPISPNHTIHIQIVPASGSRLAGADPIVWFGCPDGLETEWAIPLGASDEALRAVIERRAAYEQLQRQKQAGKEKQLEKIAERYAPDNYSG